MDNNEAFEKFISELDFQDICHDTESIRQLYRRAWQAAQQQSAGEIAELNAKINQFVGLVGDLETDNLALKADNKWLRDALAQMPKIVNDDGCFDISNKIIDEALAKTAPQCLQEHHDIIQKRYKYLKDRSYLNNRGWVIEAIKYHNAPTTFENDLDRAIESFKGNQNETA